jgi:molybdopterin-guanine dinucleotide biosynthesis protein A
MIRVGGIVLCGGQSKRMGKPKAWLPFAGEIMLSRVVRADVPVVRDEEKGHGPLQGLLAGLQALDGHADAAYLSSCDVPFLQPAFVRRLIELLGDRAICVPQIGEHHHPLAAVYRFNVRSDVERLLQEDRLRLFYLFDAVPTRVVDASELADVDPEFQSLRNLNTPEEYEAALAMTCR